MANMMELIDELWFLKRDIVSNEFDIALDRLAQELPMQIHEVASGTKIWTWTVPEKWTCHEAYLETLSGERLIDYADHPLHVVSYSLPFEGEVSREELFEHLHVHADLPDAIPFVFKYYQRDWGLCATEKLRETLNDDHYRVVIKSEFSSGSVRIGEVFLKGESDDTFVLAAHLDHPGMVNDDLSGVVVGLDVMKALKAGPQPHFSYRFLIFPETLGSIAYLSQHDDLIPSMHGGLFLEMLGNDAPHALQRSFQPESMSDQVLEKTFRSSENEGYVGSYRTIIDNDERQFNAPGVRIPMMSLSRVENPELPETRFRPYPEYHSSFDTPAIVNQARLEASRDLVLNLIEALEENQIDLSLSFHDNAKIAEVDHRDSHDENLYIVNQFKGEVFASGYGIWVDYREDEGGHKRLFEIIERCDGTRRPSDIADELEISVETVMQTIDQLLEKELVSLSKVPQPSDPHL
jgi:aminopeptidase-like protein